MPPDDGSMRYSAPDDFQPGPQPTLPENYRHPGFWGTVGQGLNALGGDISDLAKSIWGVAKIPGEVLEGKYQPGTPEMEEAARNFALTFGTPGGAPAATEAEGAVLSSGARGLRRSSAAKAETKLSKPNIGQGSEAPMFDYSKLDQPVEGVPQTDLPRYDPPRGVPEKYTRAMEDPANVKRFTGMVKQGREAGLKWYGTQPLREAFHEELGPEVGEAMFQRYMDYVGAASPRSKVPENVRNASHYFGEERRGNPPIETVLDPGNAPKLVSNLPQPYGHIAQRLHSQNVRNLRGMDPVGEGIQVRPTTSMLGPGWPVLENPKPPSFTSNLLGNWRPVTADVHNVRGWRLGDIPGKTGYGYMERVQQRLAKKLGMTPAQMQAAGWVGGELETNMMSGADPFLKHFEDRVRHTAVKRREHPQQTLRKFLRGEADLLHAGDPASAVASGAAQTEQDNSQ